MGQCITQGKDFDSFCEIHKEAIENLAEEKSLNFITAANELWEQVDNADPLGGDRIDD